MRALNVPHMGSFRDLQEAQEGSPPERRVGEGVLEEGMCKLVFPEALEKTDSLA